MGKPSMFSKNYEQQLRRRRLNIFLFVLLILCITFFGGKYLLDKNNINVTKSMSKYNIVKKVSDMHLWTKIKTKFIKDDAKKEETKPDITNKEPEEKAVQASTTPQGVSNNENPVNILFYTYTSVDGKKYNIEYENTNSGVVINGLKADIGAVNYDISKNKDMIVFEDVSGKNLVTCDSKGNFKIVSRDSYRTKSTGKVIPKAAILGSYKDYVWAAKPHFTNDGRIVYVSRLPYIKQDTTLYLWSEKIDGSEHKKLSKLNKDINKISYDGFDDKGKLRVNVEGQTYYLDIGSYMLVK